MKGYSALKRNELSDCYDHYKKKRNELSSHEGYGRNLNAFFFFFGRGAVPVTHKFPRPGVPTVVQWD